MHAVLLEVVGKQAYIFGTNKLREAVGASQLVAEATTTWLADVDALGVTVQRVVMVSGRAVLTVSSAGGLDEEVRACRALLRGVTTRALGPDAHGMRLLGVWNELPAGVLEPGDVTKLEVALQEAWARGAQPQARLPRLPVVAACRTSDGPAAHLLDDGSGDGAEPLSAAGTAKRAANHAGRDRIRDRLRDIANVDVELVAARDLEKVLDSDVKWLGVVHADGNRVGELVRGLGELDGSFQDNYGSFSQAVDACTVRALGDAVLKLRTLRDDTEPKSAGRPLPLVPLIAGGDDLTALIDGRYALPFVAAYLRAFEERSKPIAEAVRERRGYLTASAGVAMVKPHFPFSVAYTLCGQACDSAKRLAGRAGVSALDWQVHYDSVGRDLDAVRADLRRGDDYTLLRRPYAVLRDGVEPPPQAEGRNWALLERLARDVPVLPHPEQGEALPATQLHRLRAVLTDHPPQAAEQLFQTLGRRPELALLRELGDTLFVDVPSDDPARRERSTLLLDFMDADFVDPKRK